MTFVRGAAFTGARAFFSLDSKEIGYATGCNGNEQILRQALRTLGSIYVREHVPVGYDMAFSAVFARLVGKSLKSDGVWPKHMPSSEEFLREILRFQNMKAALEDVITKKTIVRIVQVAPMSLNWSVDAAGLFTLNCTFAGVKQLDESE